MNLWAFGHPNGLGGGGAYGFPDPTTGATGANVYGVNLNGNYATGVGAQLNLTSPALKQSLDVTTTNWVDATNRVSVAGTNNQVIIPLATGNHFFRLIHP